MDITWILGADKENCKKSQYLGKVLPAIKFTIEDYQEPIGRLKISNKPLKI